MQARNDDFIAGDLPILGFYDKQRFKQFNPEDAANWFLVPNAGAKKKAGMYPAMGRKHVNFMGINRLIFGAQPRRIARTVAYSYFVVGDSIFREDKEFNRIEISDATFTSTSTPVYFDYLVTGQVTFAVFADGNGLYIYNETTGSFKKVTDTHLMQAAPYNTPTYVKAFGNRLVVAYRNSPLMVLSAINLALSGSTQEIDPATCFTVAGNGVFALETGNIRNFGVLHNTLYVFKDFTTGVWSNTTSSVVDPVTGTVTTFPWRKNTSYEFDYGLASSDSLDVNFSRMVWLGQNQDGLVQVMKSDGDLPVPISTKAIDVLFENNANTNTLSPFVQNTSEGFLYQYENTVFFRLSAGLYNGTGLLDQESDANSIEFNFDSNTWERCIELNGERSRIVQHIYFNNRHLVTVQGESTVYQMSGRFYVNEITNPAATDPQAADAYIQDPFRYERITPIIAEDDYGEFETEWAQIDFVWGDESFIRTNTPFSNTEFIADEDGSLLITEDSPPSGDNQEFLIVEGTDTPQRNESIYFAFFKPHIELYFSDDGGISYTPCSEIQFSDLGIYSWRMRWYQLGCSRNRVYKLIAVSPAPIVVLGGIHSKRRVSDGSA